MSGPSGGDAQFDEAFTRIQRSDWSYVATRVLVLGVTFFLLARAIERGATAGFLLLPLVVEFLSVIWLGLVLGYTVVDCPKFVAETRRPGRVVLWTCLLVASMSIVLGWEAGGGFDTARIAPAWMSAWHEIVSTGVVWAMTVEVLGLAVSSAREVAEWRRAGGTFTWSSVFAPSLRIAVVVLMAIFSPFVLIPLADNVLPWLLETQARISWTVFGFLLVVELAGLAVGVSLHRSLTASA